MPTNPFEPLKEGSSQRPQHARLAALAAIVDAESTGGLRWWPGSEMAPVALRRWLSFERRNKAKHPSIADRIRDLAKGLQAHFEPDTPYTAWSEWLHLADKLAAELTAAHPPDNK